MDFIGNLLKKWEVEDNTRYCTAWSAANKQQEEVVAPLREEIWILTLSGVLSSEYIRNLDIDIEFHAGDKVKKLEQDEVHIYWVRHLKTGAEFRCFNDALKKVY